MRVVDLGGYERGPEYGRPFTGLVPLADLPQQGVKFLRR